MPFLTFTFHLVKRPFIQFKFIKISRFLQIKTLHISHPYMQLVRIYHLYSKYILNITFHCCATNNCASVKVHISTEIVAFNDLQISNLKTPSNILRQRRMNPKCCQ